MKTFYIQHNQSDDYLLKSEVTPEVLQTITRECKDGVVEPTYLVIEQDGEDFLTNKQVQELLPVLDLVCK